MRLLTARKTRPYFVWHVPKCREVKGVLWIDDETNEWHDGATHQAREVRCHYLRSVVFIDPVDECKPSTI